MSHPGFTKPNIKNCVQGVMVLAGLKQPKKPRKARAKETTPREQPEREFRNEVIKHLRKKGCIVKRMENGVCGKLGRGVPDLLVFCPTYDENFFIQKMIFYFLELKSDVGQLGPEQEEFKKCCEAAGVRHVVARTLDDISILCG